MTLEPEHIKAILATQFEDVRVLLFSDISDVLNCYAV